MQMKNLRKKVKLQNPYQELKNGIAPFVQPLTPVLTMFSLPSTQSFFNMRLLSCLVAFLLCSNLEAQFSRQLIDTDSSEIEIVKNADYRFFTETYKYKDSVWYSVSFLNDTTQIREQGWHRKNRRHLGVWKQYTETGEWMYVWDHDKGTCVVNPKFYPYHYMLEDVKRKADSLLIYAYGIDFVKRHIFFNFELNAYVEYIDQESAKPTWLSKKVGSWVEPLEKIPNNFYIGYEVRLACSDEKFINLTLSFDSTGNYIPEGDLPVYVNSGFEKIKGRSGIFTINKEIALSNAKKHGLILNAQSEVDGFLKWESFKTKDFYNGQFRYYLTVYKGHEAYTKGPERKGIVKKYDAYVFNPWNCKFVKRKKMKSIQEWTSHGGHSTGLIDDVEK
jgi:hypothetical protein